MGSWLRELMSSSELCMNHVSDEENGAASETKSKLRTRNWR